MSSAGDGNVFTDLSGIAIPTSENPYNALIDACADSPVRITLGFSAPQ